MQNAPRDVEKVPVIPNVSLLAALGLLYLVASLSTQGCSQTEDPVPVESAAESTDPLMEIFDNPYGYVCKNKYDWSATTDYPGTNITFEPQLDGNIQNRQIITASRPINGSIDLSTMPITIAGRLWGWSPLQDPQIGKDGTQAARMPTGSQVSGQSEWIEWKWTNLSTDDQQIMQLEFEELR